MELEYNSAFVYKNEEGKLEVDVPVTYEVYGRVRCTFESVEEMNRLLKDGDYLDSMILPNDGEYVDGTYTINEEQLECDMEEAKEKVKNT